MTKPKRVITGSVRTRGVKNSKKVNEQELMSKPNRVRESEELIKSKGVYSMRESEGR